MKCPTHPSVDAIAFCGQCGRALCPDCKREVRGMIYCESCLAARLQSSNLPPILGPGGGPQPGLALFLGFIPGAGAAYNGQLGKGLIQLLIFITLWALAERVDVMGWAVAAYWVYLVIDSYRTAKQRLLGLPTEEWLGLGEHKLRMNAPIAAAILIGLGALFLFDNLDPSLHIFEHVWKFWPLLLIVVGVILLQRRMGGGTTPPAGTGTASPGAPPNVQGPKGL